MYTNEDLRKALRRLDERTKPQPFKKPTRKQPTEKTLSHWLWWGYCKATDGCKVEPDGGCKHGHVSWLKYLGLI